MKKFIAIATLALAFISANNTVALAQHDRWSSFNEYLSSPERHYDRVRDLVREGDRYYRDGNYRRAESAYEDARYYNDRSGGHKYISSHDLDGKISDCDYAIRHHGKTRREVEREKDEAIGKAIGYTIGTLIANSNNNKKATPAQNNVQTTKEVNNALSHYYNNGISYDANTNNIHITSVNRNANSLTVNFEYLNLNKRSELSLNDAFYLKDQMSNRKFMPIAFNGINYGSSQRVFVDAGESYYFSVTFPAVSADCHSIDIIEPGQAGMKFYHVAI